MAEIEDPHAAHNAESAARFGKELHVRWYAVVNDLLGGWAVSHIDKPLSEQDFRKGEGELADFCSREIAEHIAEVHNAWLDAHIDGYGTYARTEGGS